MITPIRAAMPRFATVPATTTTASGGTTGAATGTSTVAAAAGTASSDASQPGGAMGEDQFLQLLVAQLQNQDPMNPMQGDQMASELAQFSSLEQLQQINQNLTTEQTSQGALLGAIQSNAAIGMIGHTVVAPGNQVQLGGDGGASSVMVNLSGAAAKSTLTIYDSAGTVVGSRDVGALGSGPQTVSLDDAVSGLPDGTYTYALSATDASGNPVTVQTYTTGKVDGISTGANGLILTCGTMAIPYATVTQILD